MPQTSAPAASWRAAGLRRMSEIFGLTERLVELVDTRDRNDEPRTLRRAAAGFYGSAAVGYRVAAANSSGYLVRVRHEMLGRPRFIEREDYLRGNARSRSRT